MMDPDFVWTTREEKLLVVAYWWHQQEGRCCICSLPMLPYKRQETKDRDRATVEHLIPRRDGGPNTVANIRLAHASCNHALGGLWSINQVRAASGLEPLDREWALRTDARLQKQPGRRQRRQLSALALMTAEENDRRLRAYFSKTTGSVVVERNRPPKAKKVGVKWCAATHISLPRGATFLPEYDQLKRKIGLGDTKKKPHPRSP